MSGLRVLHVGLGPLGRAMVRDLHSRGMGTVVAAVDVDPDLAGHPLAEVVDGIDSNVTITDTLESVPLAGQVDAAVVTTASDLAACAPTFRWLLGQGLPVISTCEELLYPWLRHAGLAGELDALARAKGGRLLGTGVNPGFLMDTLPAVASTVCRGVARAEVWRVQDATSRRIPFQRKIGACHSEAEFERRRAEGSLRHVGLGESLYFLAEALGFTLERWEESLDPVRAERPLTCGLGEIEPGGIAGVRQVAIGWDDGGVERVRLEFVAAIGQADPHDRVRLTGEPPIDLAIKQGVHGDIATCAVTLNSLEPLIAAQPGLHTMRTIGLPSCRYHPAG